MLASVVFHCLAVLGGILTGFGETSVKVTQLPESTSRNMGTNVSFHCSLPFFQDGPRVNIYWWKEGDNQDLSTEQDDRKVIGFKTKFSGFLQISNVSVEDAGIYYCTVAHRDKIVGNGTGSNLVVWVPPTPLRVMSQQAQKGSFVSLAVLCVTSPFYPKNISFTWYKDGTKIASRIDNIIELKTDGLYEASSRLQEAQSVRTGTVYTCLVSHSTLHISATATHIVTYPTTDGELTRCLLISSAAWGGLVLLLLGLLIAKRCISKKNKGVQNDGERCDYPEQKTATDVMAPYAELDTTNLRKAPRPKHQERTVYAQTNHRSPGNKLTYAALDMAGLKGTAKANCKDTSTEYAQVRMEKQRADVLYTHQNAM